MRLTFTSKICNVIICIVYALVYHYVYTNYMYEFFAYMFCPDPSPILKYFWLYLFLAAFPIFFYKGFKTIASGLSFFVYLLIYVPMIYVTLICNIDKSISIGVLLALFLFISLNFMTDEIVIGKRRNNTRKHPILILEIITLISFFVVLLVEGRSLKFVNILSQSDLMYDMRAQYGSTRLAITGYLISWLKTAFLPVLLVYYLKSKNTGKYFLILLAYLIMFMLDMQKITFVMPYIISLAYLGANKYNLGKLLHISIISLFSVLSTLLVFTINNLLSGSLAAIFIMRMQCLESWIFSLYLDFFQNHPYTYYSHITIVNSITHSYPYKQALGVAVTEGGMNANASFLVTDGYAAMGIPGMLFIGFIFIILKCVFNGVDKKYNRNMLLLTMFPAISSMLNVSLFTAIFSCGFLLLFLIYRYIDLEAFEKS